ncbi:MAG: hypothetical protein VB031_04160 [Eubacteriaceae bacterium]|nr:hypothetical protein [Eubacteriaceae bacterium]
MNRFKDFIYNKNDIIIALIILVIAACVIFFRIKAIMDYPQLMSEQNQTQTTQNKTVN